MKATLLLLIIIAPMILKSQGLSTKSQFWTSALTGNDVPKGQSQFESALVYIPTVSFSHNIDSNSLLDFEWAYRFDGFFSGDSLASSAEKNYRLWLRYSNPKWEARLGLQKIVFGPSQILRSLSWFDTIDLKDPTNQTSGVDAFRIKWFPEQNITLWSWAIWDKTEPLSLGGRAEITTPLGEAGVTFHSLPAEKISAVNQLGTTVIGKHQRYAFDFRYDGVIGSWLESAYINSDIENISMITLGADYTIPVSNGILFMTESMWIQKYDEDNRSYSVVMSMLPLGMVHSVMIIFQRDWQKEMNYTYFRWSSTYDRISLNFIGSLSPGRKDYDIPVEFLPETVAGFGKNFQFMCIYDY